MRFDGLVNLVFRAYDDDVLFYFDCRCLGVLLFGVSFLSPYLNESLVTEVACRKLQTCEAFGLR